MRRRSRSSARVTTAARLRSVPAWTTSSTKATNSSGRRTAICLLIPQWYQSGTRTRGIGIPRPERRARLRFRWWDDRSAEPTTLKRLITLWLLYIVGHDVGRFISIEKLIDDSRESYYRTLGQSTERWHDGKHDLGPWTGYFLGILIAAYREFESRANILVGRGSKKALITTFIDSLLADEFTVSAVRQAAPGVSDAYISKALSELKQAGVLEPIGTGRGARWRRLRGEP